MILSVVIYASFARMTIGKIKKKMLLEKNLLPKKVQYNLIWIWSALAFNYQKLIWYY